MKLLLITIFSLTLSYSYAQLDTILIVSKVDSLVEVSRKLTNQDQFRNALEINLLAEELVKNNLGLLSKAYGDVIFNKGRILDFQGNLDQAEQFYLESKMIREKVLGVNHPDYAESLNNLGYVYQIKGNYKQSEACYLESKKIRAQSLGKNNSKYAGSLNNLGILYYEMGNFAAAEKYYLECKKIKAQVLGTEHPSYAGTINNLGNLYNDLGNYKKAESNYLECKKIDEKIYGKNHPFYAKTLNNLATLYYDLNDYEKAENYQLECKAIRAKVYGKSNLDYAQSLNNLGILYSAKGEFQKAKESILECLTIREKLLGKNHPIYAGSLSNLATVYIKTGAYEKALEISNSSLKVIQTAFGKEHPTFSSTHRNIGAIYFEMGDFQKAGEIYKEVSDLNQKIISKAISHLSEKELTNYLSKFKSSQNALFTLAMSAPKIRDMMISACFDNSLFYKGFLLETSKKIKNLVLTDSISSINYQKLKLVKIRLAKEYSKPISKRANIKDLEDTANSLEKELAKNLKGFEEANQQIKWQNVRNHLKEGEIAIEFVHFDFKRTGDSTKTIYGAMILSPNSKTPVFKVLFEEEELKSILNLNQEKKADYVNALYDASQRGLVPTKEKQKSLFDLIWEPLEEEVSGAKLIYFSSSGLLHYLNLGALPVSDELWLADKYDLIQMGSTRQLVFPKDTLKSSNRAFIFGGVNYDPIKLNEPKVESTLISQTTRGSAWNYLTYTEKEASFISTKLGSNGMEVKVFKGQEATEDSFKSISKNNTSLRVLHIATHGFFFSENSNPLEKGKELSKEPIFMSSKNPMMRSGLIMAGGNYSWNNGEPINTEMEDGILTAYEISQTNLLNTELVVLSACETGLGELRDNEGLYGLQRAFKIAGANYIIMSLWQVPDRQTSILMKLFYGYWIENKLSIPAAFRRAQKELREYGFSPYQWAGFVLVE